MSKIIRISETAYKKLSQLEDDMGASKKLIIEKALDRLAREKLFKKAHEAYTALRDDPAAWSEECKEREEWDVTLSDGLKDKTV